MSLNHGLRAEGLTVRRGKRAVVHAIDFSAAAGAVTVLLGPNGAGKSSVLKAIAGLLPAEGRIALGAHDAATLDQRARARAVAYVPQESALGAALPVRDVVAQGRFAHGELGFFRRLRPADTAAVGSALERMDASALAERPFDTLSYGERRRVLIARALASQAPILLLDEPTASLDVGHALALLRVLRQVAATGTAVVVVLHHLDEAATVADAVVLLDRGQVAAAGPVTAVIAPEPIRRVYGVEMIANAGFGFRLPAGDAP
jgi:iron complex transport system ATP-binding protein